MKLIYKSFMLCFLLLLSPRLWSRDIVLIENQATSSEGELLKKILTKKYHIPRELITLRNTTSACEKKSEAIIHLCLGANGELQVEKMNQFVVKNSLGVFLNQENEGEVE